MMGTKLRRSLHVGLTLGALAGGLRVALGVASLGAGAASVEACSITSTDGGVLLKTQTKFTANGPVTAQSMGTYAGEVITIYNQNGNVIVNGDPNATSISLSTVPFAYADTQDDGSAAIADVEGTIKIDQSTPGTIKVSCSVATTDHGSAKNGTTGCGDFTVTVPSGTAANGLTIDVHGGGGDVSAKGLYLTDANQSAVRSDNGNVTASVAGSVKVDAQNGQVTATVVPNKGSRVEASSGNGDVTLSLPKDFSCDALSLSAMGPGATVDIGSGFTNSFTASSTSVGTAGSGAASVTVSTENGSITLSPQ